MGKFELIDNEIKFTEANLVFGDKKRKKIIGPENWKHPYKGETIKVYKRTRKSQSGLKTQLFTITNDGQCIGRVWDSRRGGKVIENGCKFPLGLWKKGETCLLYTSPSPRDATLSRMPSSA